MKRLCLILTLFGCATALAAAGAGAAPVPGVLTVHETGGPSEFVDANNNGFPDPGDYQTFTGTLSIVPSGGPGVNTASAPAQGTLSGKLVFLPGGRVSITAVLSLPRGTVAVGGTANLNQTVFSLQAFGVSGAYQGSWGVAAVTPNDSGALIELRFSRRR
jgi:hypothetical protein